MSEKSVFKFVQLAVLTSTFCTSCAIADHITGSTETNEQPGIEVDLATQQMEQEKQEEQARLDAERKAEEARLSAEKQQQAENALTEKIGDRALQFRNVIAKIYADNHYVLLWEDKAAEKQFLREYAAMVASGISSRSAKSLSEISNADPQDSLTYDILLTDAFLDYMYYAHNVAKSAQNWLYSANNYKAAKPADEQIETWLNAVKNQQATGYLQGLAAKNPLYYQTLGKLFSSVETGKKKSAPVNNYKLALNAQRLRMIGDFTNGIFVNIPSYQLNYYRDGKLVLNSRVIVGKNQRRTPVMQSQLSNVVVNPPWNAPVRLINEDIIPKVKRDPSYLARNGYSIIDSRGNVVNPANIDWGSIGSKFPYHLRQAAGDNSALGRYKFNMPSSDAIYLHDTPNHGLFNQQMRALSSGCVRVDKSSQLADIFLKEAGWSDAKKEKVLASRKTTWQNVQSANPVYLYYVTTWVENGKIHTLPDIYGYDNVKEPSYIDWNIIKKYLN